MKPCTLNYTAEAAARIRHLPPPIKQQIRLALDALHEDPWQGKPLQRELAGLWALRVRQMRIIYRIEQTRGRVEILTLGPRQTIYGDLTGTAQRSP